MRACGPLLVPQEFIEVAGVEVPRIDDVGRTLEENKDLLPADIREHMVKIRSISKRLRKERELDVGLGSHQARGSGT